MTQLIVINVIAFIFINVAVGISRISHFEESVILKWFLLPSGFNEYTGKFWTVFTYMFLHLNLWHILSNMLWLYWLGGIFQEYLGNKRLYSVYILGGLSGGLLYLLLYNVLSISVSASYLLGASASVMAIVVAIAILLPEYSIHLILIGPVRLKYLALASFVLTTVIDLSQNTGGKVAHIGGALFGVLYMVQYKKGRDLTVVFSKLIGLFSFKKRNKMKIIHKKEEYKLSKASLQKKVDEILDKIAKSGYESLTKEEKDILFKASGRI